MKSWPPDAPELHGAVEAPGTGPARTVAMESSAQTVVLALPVERKTHARRKGRGVMLERAKWWCCSTCTPWCCLGSPGTRTGQNAEPICEVR